MTRYLMSEASVRHEAAVLLVAAVVAVPTSLLALLAFYIAIVAGY